MLSCSRGMIATPTVVVQNKGAAMSNVADLRWYQA